MSTERILYLSTQTKSPGREITGNTITWRVKHRAYPHRSALAQQIVMIEREGPTGVTIECRELTSWTTERRGKNTTHVVTFGRIRGEVVDAKEWIQTSVGPAANGSTSRVSRFRPGWAINMFTTAIASLERYGMIPECDREANTGFIRFKCFEREGTPACIFEVLDVMPDEPDEFSTYAECDDVHAFAHYLNDVYAERWSADHGDYALTEADISALVSPSEGRLKRVYAKTEKKVETWMRSRDWDVTCQAKFDWCKKKLHLRFDFHVRVGKRDFILEIDGRQHFEDVAYFKSIATDVQANDKFKAECALDRGFDVIRLYQEDAWNDTYDWQQAVTTALESRFDCSTMHYIARDRHQYDAHRALLPFDQ